MSTQLTIQTPLQIPVSEIPSYLKQLWEQEPSKNKGANTFALVVWNPAWLEQGLVSIGKINGPIIGNQREEIIAAAREIIVEKDLPHSTPPFDKKVSDSLEIKINNGEIKDLRGQHIDSAISQLQPRRLITLAPTLKSNQKLETLVAAYCPLPEDGGSTVCGDAIVLRGDVNLINDKLPMVEKLIPEELPSWLWWNGPLDENSELLKIIASPIRRIIIDSALGNPKKCLDLLLRSINAEQAVNDLNWLRLRAWRETLAMVFDPPNRRAILGNLINIDIDIESDHPVQGLLLIGWIADRLGWTFKNALHSKNNGLQATFERSDKEIVNFNLMPLPLANPSIHPGQIIGLRLISISNSNPQRSVCIILASESGECMRLEAGGMASMELIEQVVPNQDNSSEQDVARLLSTSRGSTSPLLERATPIASQLLNTINS